MCSSSAREETNTEATDTTTDFEAGKTSKPDQGLWAEPWLAIRFARVRRVLMSGAIRGKN